MGGGLFAVKLLTLHLPACVRQETGSSAGHWLIVLAITDTTSFVVSFDFMEISAAQCVHLLNLWVYAFSDLHGLATGLQSHHAGSKCSTEGLPGAGEQAARGQPAAGGPNSRLGYPKHLSVT